MPRQNALPIELNIVQQGRFWSHVNGVSDAPGCWLWSGRTDDFGYGHFKTRTRSLKAHRVAWTLKRGPIPAGQTLDHLCRNPRCVNPSHLELVTNKENILRGESPTAKNARRGKCIRGHELIDSPYPSQAGHRICLTCIAAVHETRKADRLARGARPRKSSK